MRPSQRARRIGSTQKSDPQSRHDTRGQKTNSFMPAPCNGVQRIRALALTHTTRIQRTVTAANSIFKLIQSKTVDSRKQKSRGPLNIAHMEKTCEAQRMQSHGTAMTLQPAMTLTHHSNQCMRVQFIINETKNVRAYSACSNAWPS